MRNTDRGNYRHSPVPREEAYRFQYSRPASTARATHPEYLLLNPETDTPYFDKRTDREVLHPCLTRAGVLTGGSRRGR